jgi:hypothetical protein
MSILYDRIIKIKDENDYKKLVKSVNKFSDLPLPIQTGLIAHIWLARA